MIVASAANRIELALSPRTSRTHAATTGLSCIYRYLARAIRAKVHSHRIYLHEIDKARSGGAMARGGEKGVARGAEKEVGKCPRGKRCRRRSPARAPRCVTPRRWQTDRQARPGQSGPLARRAQKRGRMLFRMVKLNYQIKQQCRYINKIDFAGRSSKRKSRPGRPRRFASNLVSRNSRFNHVARTKT